MKSQTRVLVALAAAGSFLSVPSAAGSSAVTTTPCPRTFTLAMFGRAASLTYSGSGLPHRGAYGHLWRYARCQRPPSSETRARALWHSRLEAWATRRRASIQSSMRSATVSWYDDAGQTASGFHATYGVAVCGSGGGPCVPFGTRIQFCYHGRCVTATADDHGPYVSGRAFDLSTSTAQAIGFSGVDAVAYRIE